MTFLLAAVRPTTLLAKHVLVLKEQEFVTASLALGDGHGRLVLIESSLSYLGFGIQPPNTSWGGMLNNAQSYVVSSPWLAVLPGVMITATVVGFNVFGDALRDMLDPRLDV